MVTVPQQNGPSVAPQALPNPRNNVQVSLENLGGGQGLQNVNTAYQDVLKDVNHRVFQDRMMEASRALDDFELKTIYDKDTGLLRLKGKEAGAAPGQYEKAFQMFSQSQMEQTSDPEARQALTQMFAARNAHIQGTLADHVSKQSDVYHKSELASGIQSSIAISTQDPSRVPSRLESVRANSEELARAEGFEPGSETSKLLIAQNIETLHDRVVNNMMEQHQFGAAKAYLAQYGSQMPNTIGKYSKALESADVLGEAQRLVDEKFADKVSIITGVPPAQAKDVTPGIKTLKELQTEGDKIKDVALRDEFMRRGESRLRVNEYIEKKDREDATERISNQVEDWASDPRSARQIESPLDFVNQDDLRKLKHSDYKALQAYVKKVQKGEMVEPDDVLYNDLRIKAALSPETQKEFLDTDLSALKLTGKLDKSRYETLLDIKTKLLSKNPSSADPANKGYLGVSSRLNNSLIDLGIDPTPLNQTGDQAKALARLRGDIETALIEKANNHKPPIKVTDLTAKEEQETIDEFLGDVQYELDEFGNPKVGFFGGIKSKKLFELTPEERANYQKKQQMEVGGVPLFERNKIIKAFEDAGKPTNDPAILLEAWNEIKRRRQNASGR